jgi:hypothetical protein
LFGSYLLPCCTHPRFGMCWLISSHSESFVLNLFWIAILCLCCFWSSAWNFSFQSLQSIMDCKCAQGRAKRSCCLLQARRHSWNVIWRVNLKRNMNVSPENDWCCWLFHEQFSHALMRGAALPSSS